MHNERKFTQIKIKQQRGVRCLVQIHELSTPAVTDLHVDVRNLTIYLVQCARWLFSSTSIVFSSLCYVFDNAIDLYQLVLDWLMLFHFSQ